jgi:hypothetical protein
VTRYIEDHGPAVNFFEIEVRHDEFFTIEYGLNNVMGIRPDNRAAPALYPLLVIGRKWDAAWKPRRWRGPHALACSQASTPCEKLQSDGPVQTRAETGGTTGNTAKQGWGR